MRFVSEPSKHAKLNEDPTKSVGRISLSAESLRIQFIIGRHGNLPYEVCRPYGVCRATALLLGQPPINHTLDALSSVLHCPISSPNDRLVSGHFAPIIIKSLVIASDG